MRNWSKSTRRCTQSPTIELSHVLIQAGESPSLPHSNTHACRESERKVWKRPWISSPGQRRSPVGLLPFPFGIAQSEILQYPVFSGNAHHYSRYRIRRTLHHRVSEATRSERAVPMNDEACKNWCCHLVLECWAINFMAPHGGVEWPRFEDHIVRAISCGSRICSRAIPTDEPVVEAHHIHVKVIDGLNECPCPFWKCVFVAAHNLGVCLVTCLHLDHQEPVEEVLRLGIAIDCGDRIEPIPDICRNNRRGSKHGAPLLRLLLFSEPIVPLIGTSKHLSGDIFHCFRRNEHHFEWEIRDRTYYIVLSHICLFEIQHRYLYFKGTRDDRK